MPTSTKILIVMVANLIARYIWEINELARSRKGLTLRELNERWEDSKLYDEKEIIRKTWYSHRQQILMQFGIDIACDKPNNRYYIAHTEEIGQPEIQNWLLNSFAISNMLLQGKDMKGRILYEEIPSGYEYLTDLIEAMRDNRVITITYQSFWKDKVSTFDLKPLALKVFRQRWYLLGGNISFDGMRVYALDRIQDIEITPKKFRLPKGFDAESIFEPYVGVSLDDIKTEKVRIKVFNNQGKYFRSLPLHSSQEEIRANDEYTIFEYHLKPTYEFKQELLSHGGDVVVLEPESLRKEMIEKVKEMAWRYEL